jgi:hypothetical protein
LEEVALVIQNKKELRFTNNILIIPCVIWDKQIKKALNGIERKN